MLNFVIYDLFKDYKNMRTCKWHFLIESNIVSVLNANFFILYEQPNTIHRRTLKESLDSKKVKQSYHYTSTNYNQRRVWRKVLLRRIHTDLYGAFTEKYFKTNIFLNLKNKKITNEKSLSSFEDILIDIIPTKIVKTLVHFGLPMIESHFPSFIHQLKNTHIHILKDRSEIETLISEDEYRLIQAKFLVDKLLQI